MDVYKACRLSTTSQAFYEDPFGNLYLATYYCSQSGGWASGSMSYLRRKKKKNYWKNGETPWKQLFSDPESKVRNRWMPVAPIENI